MAFIDNFNPFGIKNSKVLNLITLSGGLQRRREIGEDLMVLLMEWICCTWTSWHSCSRVQSTIFPRFVSYAYMGGSVGTVLTYPFCGWLLSWAKWEVWTCLINHILFLFTYFVIALLFYNFHTLGTTSSGCFTRQEGSPCFGQFFGFPSSTICQRTIQGFQCLFRN